ASPDVDLESLANESGLALKRRIEVPNLIPLILLEVPARDRDRRMLERGFALGADPHADWFLNRAQPSAKKSGTPPRPGHVGLERCHVAHPVTHTSQCSSHAVVLSLADRVELVVVTTGAVDRDAEERLADRADQFLDLVLPHDLSHRLALLRLADAVVGT